VRTAVQVGRWRVMSTRLFAVGIHYFEKQGITKLERIYPGGADFVSKKSASSHPSIQKADTHSVGICFGCDYLVDPKLRGYSDSIGS